MTGMNGMGGGAWLLMWCAGLIAVSLLVVTVVAVVRPSGPPRAESLLGSRFARGEIDAQEYAHRLRVLRSR